MTAVIANEIEALVQHSESIKNDDAREYGNEWSVGDCAAQGDVLIVNIGTIPESAKPRENRQVADGNTIGSRHIVERGDIFDADAAEVCEMIRTATGKVIDSRFVGPVFSGPATLTHPEHGDQAWLGECVNAVVYQRVWDAEQAASRRVLD